MRAFLVACAAVIGIAIAAYYGLNAVGFSAADSASAGSVRLD